MGKATEPMLAEFREEAATTKRVLERVPAQKLAWKPHAKSMTLGQLAWHIAKVPGDLARITQPDSFDVSQGSFVPPQPKNLEEVFSVFEESVRDAEKIFEGNDGRKSARQLEIDATGAGVNERPAHLDFEKHHAESLVSPSRTVIGVPAIAGCSIAGDLWAERG